ncbi:MAG TPA: (2Fe-2S)-binding protein [Sandaracinaceae bacterium]
MNDKIMICRCEDVTLAEVEEAIAKGYDDLESLKRYTGFGTGWCQGKQCVALASRVLVERGGQPPEAPITPRQPFHPIALAHLACLVDEEEPE